jgi:hypothetical protein
MKKIICLFFGHRFDKYDIFNGSHCKTCNRNFRGVLPKSILFNHRFVRSENMLKDIPMTGKHWPMQRFVRDCLSGFLIDYDGYAYYATKDGMTDIKLLPSDVLDNEVDNSYKYVVWFYNNDALPSFK